MPLLWHDFITQFENSWWFLWAPLFFLTVSWLLQYPFDPSEDLDMLVQNFFFVAAGLVAGVYVVVRSLIVNEIRLSRLFLLLLGFIGVVLLISTAWSVHPLLSFMGTRFEVDTTLMIVGWLAWVIFFAHYFSVHRGKSVRTVFLPFLMVIILVAMASTLIPITFISVDALTLPVFGALLTLVVIYDLVIYEMKTGALFVRLSSFLLGIFCMFQTPINWLWLALGILSVGMLVFLWRRGTTIPLGATVLVCLVVCAMSYSVAFSTTVNKSITTIDDPASMTGLLSAMFEWNYDAYFLGYGPHSFWYFWNQFRYNALNQLPGWAAWDTPPYWDNQPSIIAGYLPTIWLNGGLFTMVSWLALFFWLAQIMWRKLVSDSHARDEYVLWAAIFAVLLFLHIMETTGSGFLLMWAVVVGWWAVQESKVRSTQILSDQFVQWRFGAGILLVVLVAGGLYGLTTIYYATSAYWRGVTEYRSESGYSSVFNEAFEQAVTKFEHPHFYRAQAEGLLFNIEERLDGRTTTEEVRSQIQSELQKALLAAQEATRLNSDDPRNWLVLGRVNLLLYRLGVDDARNIAFAHFEKAALLSPYHPLPSYYKAELAVIDGNYIEASQVIKTAYALKPDFAPIAELYEYIQKHLETQDTQSL